MSVPLAPILCALLVVQLPAGSAPTASSSAGVPLARLVAAPEGPTLSADQSADLAGLVQAVTDGVAITNEDPELGRDSLRRAIKSLDAKPGLTAHDEAAYRARLDGLLTLARAELALEQEPEAIAAIDEAIRIARGENVPVTDYGPSLAKLYELRVAAPELRPDGSIHVACGSRCRVVLDGREAGLGTDVMITGIPLGRHRIRIEPSYTIDGEAFEERFFLAAATPEQAFEYDPPPPPASAGDPTGDGEANDDPKTPGGRARKLPRWASIVGISVGAVLVAGGAALLAVDGDCPDGSDPAGPDACQNTLATIPIGAALTAIGGASMIGFSVALGIGEARQKKRKTATAGITIRF